MKKNRIVLYFVASSLFSACSTTGIKHNVKAKAEDKTIFISPSSAPTPAISESNINDNKSAEANIGLENKKEPEKSESEKIPVQTVPEHKKPIFGLVLGPGSAKAFSHIGFVQEFGKQKIPVKMIFGYEIGALVGALFSKNGESFEAEWQLSKLSEDTWVPKNGFFSIGQQKAQDVESLNLFLQNAFSNQNFEDFKISFGCSSLAMKSHKLNMLTQGRATQQLKKCIAWPPLLISSLDMYAGIIAFEEVVKLMRLKGVTHIIFVNALNLSDSETDLSWNYYYSYIQSQKNLFETFVDLPTQSFTLLNVDKRNDLVKLGASEAKKLIDKLRDQYQF